MLKSTIFITLVASIVLADLPPPPASKEACLAYSKDPMEGNVECLYCYGYKVKPLTSECDTTNFDKCIFSLAVPGFPNTWCNLCEKGYAINTDDGSCPAVAEADKVENCDYYWIPEKTTAAKCMGCSKGYVAVFSKQATLDIKCIKDDTKMIANCDSMTINEFKKSHHETVAIQNCQICEEGYTLAQKIKVTGFLKDIVTSECIPQTGHFQGCAIHNKQYSILGELQASYCGMCDARANYRAHTLMGKWKNGNHMCKKWDSE